MNPLCLFKYIPPGVRVRVTMSWLDYIKLTNGFGWFGWNRVEGNCPLRVE
jgi:hypothetical protein